MAQKVRGPRQPSTVSTKMLVAVLSVFAVLVVGISAAALKGTGSREGEGFPTAEGNPQPTQTVEEAPEPEPSADVSDEVTPDPEPTVEETPTPTPVKLVEPQRILATVSDRVLVRATVGSCDEATSLEISQDGGDSWQQSAALANTGSMKALRIIPTRVGLIQLVSLNKNCEPQLVRTETQGDSWLAPIGATGAWYLDPANPTELGGPDGKLSIDCEAVALAATADRAAVLCSDSTLIASTDRGVTWSDPVPADGVTAIGLSDEGYVATFANQGACAGIQAAEFDGTKLAKPGACIEREVKAGDTAVAQAGDTVFVWAGSSFAVSPDGGKSWQS